MPLSALDCIGRGLYSLRANWPLILVQWLQGLAVTVLALAGFVPPLLVLGAGAVMSWRQASAWPEVLLGGLPDLGERLAGLGVSLLLALLATLLIWLLALVVYCFFQGGIWGILAAADRQAPPGAPRDWRWFCTFSVNHLVGWGGRFVWRYFRLTAVVSAVSLALACAVLLLVLLAAYGGNRWGETARTGIGCGGLLPIAFAGLSLALCTALAQAELARGEASAAAALRRSLALLGRRLGAVLLIAFLAALATLAVTLSSLALTFGLEAGAAGGVQAIVVRLLLMVLEWFAYGFVGIAFGAALVALVRSEAAAEVAGEAAA